MKDLSRNRLWIQYLSTIFILATILTSNIAIVKAQDQEQTNNQQKIACMKSAVEKRETSLITAFKTFADSHMIAREARKSALSAAWSIEDKIERRSAIKKAWADYKISRKAARQTWNTQRIAAWTEFQKDKTVCGYKETSGDSTKSDATL